MGRFSPQKMQSDPQFAKRVSMPVDTLFFTAGTTTDCAATVCAAAAVDTAVQMEYSKSDKKLLINAETTQPVIMNEKIQETSEINIR